MKFTRSLILGATAASALASTATAARFIYLDERPDGSPAGFALVGTGFVGTAPEVRLERPNFLDTSVVDSTSFAGTLTMSTSQNDNVMRLQGLWENPTSSVGGSGYAVMVQDFMVDEPGQILLQWDWSGTNGDVSLRLTQEGLPSFQPLFSNIGIDGDDPTGAFVVNVFPGIRYTLAGGLIEAVASEFGPLITSEQPQFYQATFLPTPSSAALLGLAGLAATRRRR